MYLSHCEIIEDFKAQIRKSGRQPSDWLVGTAKDAVGPFFQQHRAVDLGDALAYREAYATSAAESDPQQPGFRSCPYPFPGIGFRARQDCFHPRRAAYAKNHSTASLTERKPLPCPEEAAEKRVEAGLPRHPFVHLIGLVAA